MMEFVTEYWQQLVAVVFLIFTVGKLLQGLRGDVDVLKEKVKTLFDLWNNRK